MIKQHRFRGRQLRHLAVLFAIPALLITTGYAMYSQQLSISGAAARPNYSSTQNMIATYTSSTSVQGNKQFYTMVIDVTNNGSTAVESWQVAFDLPSGYSTLSCDATVVCSTSGVRLTINNGTGNGTIGPGGSLTITISFASAAVGYYWQNVSVSGVIALAYQTISGLTVSAVAGSQVKVGKVYQTPYTFTVSNNSGQSVSQWRITTNWSTTESVISMSSTVNYVTSATNLTILSKTAVANGSNFVFNATFQSSSRVWTLSGVIIEGIF